MNEMMRIGGFAFSCWAAACALASGVETNGLDVVVQEGTHDCRGLVLSEGQRLKVPSGATLRFAKGTGVSARGCSGVSVTGGGSLVGGGVSLEDVRNALVEGVRFEDVSSAVSVGGASSNVSVRSCRVIQASSACLEVGDGATDISLEDVSGVNAFRGLWVRGCRRGGRSVERVFVRGLTLRGQTECVMELGYSEGRADAAPAPTRISDISIADVSNEKAVYGFWLKGDQGLPVRGLQVSNVDLGSVRWRDVEMRGVEDVVCDGLPGLFDVMLTHGPQFLNYSVYDEAFKRVVEADRAADAAWVACKKPEELKARQAGLRARAIEAMGGLPERCALNGRVTGRIEKDGYAIEKVLFESRPGFHVTAHLFLPTAAKYAAPFPAVVVPCGHSSEEGKWGSGYQRIGVMGAREGFAVLVYDPIDQGERRQKRDGAKSWSSVHEHNAVGVRAMLLGKSQAMIRLWDGMRAVDYLETRKDVDAARIGVAGMSGGGTLSSYINAFDSRIKAGAPAGFLSTIRDVYDNCGPQDAEQQFFGELAIGFNHLGIVSLRAPSPTLMVVSHNDFFPLMGALATCERAKVVYGVAGGASAVDLQDTAGPHHWYQSNQAATLGWMKRWMLGDAQGWTREKGTALRFGDAGFAVTADNSGCALDPAECRWAAPGGSVLNLPGERTIYDIFRDERKRCRTESRAPTVETVRRVTGIRSRSELAAQVCPSSRRQASANGVTATRVILQRPDDMTMIPVVTLVQDGGAKGPPVVVVSDEKRRFALAPKLRSYLEKVRPVAVADLRGFGETATSRHSFYRTSNADEEIAVLYYALGDSLVSRRAEDLLLVARHVSEALGGVPDLLAEGRAAIPAVHAHFLERDAFGGIEIYRAPLGWSALQEDDTASYPFANCIQGALHEYDWTDLLGTCQISLD